MMENNNVNQEYEIRAAKYRNASASYCNAISESNRFITRHNPTDKAVLKFLDLGSGIFQSETERMMFIMKNTSFREFYLACQALGICFQY